MRVVLQRVSQASVVIANELYSSVGFGMMILLGIESSDEESDADWLISKVNQLRIFSDSEGKMNLSINDTGGEFMVISQFTLHASTKKGNRPSYIQAARPEHAIPLYTYFCDHLAKVSGKEVKTGVFGADMKVSLTNDGPVTICIDSKIKE